MSYKTEQSKRRIEEIRDKALKDKVQFQNIRTGENGWVNTYTLTEDDFNFLVEKAELVEELEQQNKYFRKIIRDAIDEISFFGTRLEVAVNESLRILEKELKESE